MARSLQSILGYVPLTGEIKKTTSGIPNPLPDKFFNPPQGTKKILGNVGRYTVTTGERRVSRLSKYGSASRRRELRPIGERDIKLLHSFENQPIDPLTMDLLRGKTTYEQNGGEEEVRRQVREFKALFSNMRIATTVQVLLNAKLYWDANGNLLPNSSGAIETHDFGRDAANEGQLGGIIAASWALSNTNIPAHIRALIYQAVRDTGYPIKYAFYGRNIPTYLTPNDFVQDYLSRNPQMASRYLDRSELPEGLFGVTWVPMFSTFYEDNSGTNQELWDPDTIVFTPEVDEGWWDVLEGSYRVPKSIFGVPTSEASLNMFDRVYGMFSYALGSHDPPTMVTYAGDTFIPALKNQKATYKATVAF